MREEYDFAQGKRGLFARPDAALVPPVHLEPEILDYLAKRAAARGVPLDQLINDLLRKDIELIEAAG